jgi:beta-glucanase (GH16 family)
MGGLFLNNGAPVAPYQWGTQGGPLAWVYSGEGGSTADLARFAEGNTSATGYQALGDYNTIAAGTIPGFETGIAGALGPAAAPNVNGSWVKLRLEVDGTAVNWYLNGARVDTYDNSGGFYTSGNIFFGLTDPFNSSNAGNRFIVDNVVVVPEPSTCALAVLGLGGLWLRRRRRK